MTPDTDETMREIERTEALEAAGICLVCEKAPSVPDDCMCAECRQRVTDNSFVVVDPIEKLVGQHRVVTFLSDMDHGECQCGFKWEGGPGFWRQHLAVLVHEQIGSTYTPWMPAAEWDTLHPEEATDDGK